MEKLCVSSKCFPEDALKAVEALIEILRRTGSLSPSENAHIELHTLRLACENIRKGYRESEISRAVLGEEEEEVTPARATNFPQAWSVEAVDGDVIVRIPDRPLRPVEALCYAARIASVAEKLVHGADFESILTQARKLG